jgi:short-subunit dehydrogenase
MKVNNKTAVLTGAGSGIGRAMSVALAKRGCHLALVDVNERGLEETVELLASYDRSITQHVVDLSDQDATAQLQDAIFTQHSNVQLLINNAGVALGGSFLQTSEVDFDWLMRINFGAVVQLTRSFLPHLLQQPEAALVNISSLYGLVSPIGETPYCASKFAVRGFSNALRHELADTNLQISVVHPGGIATHIAKNARAAAKMSQVEIDEKQQEAARLLRMPPEQAGEIIIRGVERGKARILVGVDAKFVALVERMMPVHYGRLLKWLTSVWGR